MQATKPYVAEIVPPASALRQTTKSESQLNFILNESQADPGTGEQDNILPLRETAARALRGFRPMDSAALVLGFIVAWGLAFDINAIFLGRYDLYDAVSDGFIKIVQSLIVGVAVIAWFSHSGHYRMRMPFWTETKKIVEVIAFAMLIDAFLRFVIKQDFSRLWLISGWFFAAAGIVSFRMLWRRRMRKKGLWQVATLLVGSGKTARDALRALESEPGIGFDVVAQITDLPIALQQAGRSWQRLCAVYRASYVIVALDGNELAKAEHAFAQLMREDIPFSVSPPLHNVPVFGMVPQYFFNHDVMLLTHNHGLNQRMPRFIKRAFDIAISATALALLSPLLLIVACIVKSDGGPALFGHRRLGLHGAAFSCLKFRSMTVHSKEALNKYLAENAEARMEWQRNHKLRNDPRVTPIGKILRRTSIDELPQLLNVLRGDMSLVGPRPIIVAETEKYSSDISHYYRVRPGITGLWQVSGRNDVSYADRVSMDSWYVRNWSLWHDIACAGTLDFQRNYSKMCNKDRLGQGDF